MPPAKSKASGAQIDLIIDRADDVIMLGEIKFTKDKFVIDISRESLATIAGTATESLIRTLSDFRNEKLIDIKEGSIIIINQKKLEHLFN